MTTTKTYTKGTKYHYTIATAGRYTGVCVYLDTDHRAGSKAFKAEVREIGNELGVVFSKYRINDGTYRDWRFF